MVSVYRGQIYIFQEIMHKKIIEETYLNCNGAWSIINTKGNKTHFIKKCEGDFQDRYNTVYNLS